MKIHTFNDPIFVVRKENKSIFVRANHIAIPKKKHSNRNK